MVPDPLPLKTSSWTALTSQLRSSTRLGANPFGGALPPFPATAGSEQTNLSSVVTEKPVIYANRTNAAAYISGSASGDQSPETTAASRIVEIMINGMPIEARIIMDNPLLDPDTPGERPQITRFYCALN